MAGPISLTYTVIGTGGLSPALAGVSAAPFWWVDTSGTTPASAVVSYGFEPFPAFVKVVDALQAGGGGGSLLLSAPFAVDGGETLQVTFELLKRFVSYANSDATAPLGFALLLQNSLVQLVLANITAEARTYFNNFGFLTTVPASETSFVPTSPGVTMTTANGTGRDVTLNGAHYAAVPGAAGLCGCFFDVTSACTPGAGTYQLLFGIYDFLSGGTQSIPDMLRGALAITDVRTESLQPAS
jgi:hypothetical protein